MREIRSPLDGIPSPFAARAALDAYLVGVYRPKVVADFAGIYSANEYYRTGGAASTFSDLFTYTGASNKTMTDSDGKLKWAPHNLALNSAAPATQSITVVSGADYTVEITGSGSVALSGAGSGTVTAGNPVEITASTTTLTLTVTGTPTTMWAYRSDLGGMVNNPDRNDSYVPTTSSAVHLPRRNHYGWNGSTWVNKGLLLETESRTNLFVESSVDEAAWGKTNTGSLSKDETGPDGELSAVTFIDSGATGTASVFLEEPISATAGVTYTVSIFAKQDQLSGLGLYTRNFVTSPSNGVTFFNLSTGLVGTTHSDHTATIEPYGGGWYRCAITFTVGGTGVGNIRIFLADGENTVVDLDGTSSIILFGAQAEAGPTPSSYMPTTGTTSIRAAETLTIPAAKMAWPTPNVIGPELVTNGTFDSATGWTLGGGWAIASGTLNWTGGYNRAAFPVGAGAFEAGKVYLITGAVSGYTSGRVNVYLASSGNPVVAIASLPNADGTFSVILSPTATVNEVGFIGNDASGARSIDNVSVREIDPLSVSLQMQGEMTYADDGTAASVAMYRWHLDVNNRLGGDISGSSGGTGALSLYQVASGVPDTVLGTVSEFSPDVNVPFNIASRHGSTFINGAVDGTALTANTTPTALPDLSTTDFSLGYDYMGTIALFREDNNDWGDAGIEEAST